MPRHRADRELRAWRDGELSWWRGLLVRAHLRRCPRCGSRLAAIDEERRLIAALLRSSDPPPDVGEAWMRLLVRSGVAARRRRSLATAGSLAAAAAALTVLTATLPGLEGRAGWGADVDWLLHPTPVESKAPSVRDNRFVQKLLHLEATGRVRILRDACCEDRDGEGPPDDGLAIVQVAGRRAMLAVLYEDIDGSGALTTGDVIRLISRMVRGGETEVLRSSSLPVCGGFDDACPS